VVRDRWERREDGLGRHEASLVASLERDFPDPSRRLNALDTTCAPLVRKTRIG
jgi:hypothetical protein